MSVVAQMLVIGPGMTIVAALVLSALIRERRRPGGSRLPNAFFSLWWFAPFFIALGLLGTFDAATATVRTENMVFISRADSNGDPTARGSDGHTYTISGSFYRSIKLHVHYRCRVTSILIYFPRDTDHCAPSPTD